jgi:capsular exopolysaccharide synthesis family protein
MSRLFDALQRAGTELSGVEYPDLVSMVTEVFESEPPESQREARAEESKRLEVPDQAAIQPVVAENPSPESTVRADLEFPSLDVSVPPDSRLVFFTDPDSLPAEKFRFLGVRLRQIQQNRPLKKVLVTSSIPEEGKSLVSANLAGVLARRGQRVLLIEGDLRRPTLAPQFGLGRLAGLGEWLQGNRDSLSNIYRLADFNFWMMPAGNPPSNPLELMQSRHLSRLMQQIGDLFDWVIVDSPPLLPLADTTVWTRVTDGTLLVARVGKTGKAQLERALGLVKKSDLLGVVLNGSEESDYKNYYQRYSPAGMKSNSPDSSALPE